MNTSLNIGLAGIHANSLQKNYNITNLANQTPQKGKTSNFSVKNQFQQAATRINSNAVIKNANQQNVITQNNTLGALYHNNNHNQSMFVNILV